MMGFAAEGRGGGAGGRVGELMLRPTMLAIGGLGLVGEADSLPLAFSVATLGLLVCLFTWLGR